MTSKMTTRISNVKAFRRESQLIALTVFLSLVMSWQNDCRAQFPPVNPDLNVGGGITSSSFQVYSVQNEWEPITHGEFLHWGSLCKGTADATANNNEEFTVTFVLGAMMVVAGGDELDEIENPWGDGTWTYYENDAELTFNAYDVSVAPMAQGELHVTTNEVAIPRFVLMPPDFEVSLRRHLMLPKHRLLGRLRQQNDIFQSFTRARSRNYIHGQWQVEVVNFGVMLGAYDTATGTLTKAIDHRWEQFIAGEILQ